MLFHSEDHVYFPRHSKFYAIHFLTHGIHHAFPQDRYRLVFPPILGLPLLKLIVVTPIEAFATEYWAKPLIIGTTLGYVGYDMIHYFLHHTSPKDGYWKMLKIYHM
jgi:4-hydroxysphinganine ceramide fatty acyl 2-hydroxylase